MSNYNQYKQIQYKKIQYFCLETKTDNVHTAERYLNEALWDENSAVLNYFQKHNNKPINNVKENNNIIKEFENNQNVQIQKPDQIEKNDKNNFENEEKVNENDENFIPLKMTKKLIEHKYNNNPTCESLNYIKNNLKSVKLEFNYFLELAKERMGIILIYNENAFNLILKDKIKEIRTHVLYSSLNENYVIFPVLNNSPIGKELSRQFLCLSYPSCLFCEYKKKEQLCITKRMDGAFDVSFFYDCIPFEQRKKYSNSSKNNIIINKNNNIPKNENDKKIEEMNKINKFIIESNLHYFGRDQNYKFKNLNKNNWENNKININPKDKNEKIDFNSNNNNKGFINDVEDKKKSENIEINKQNYKQNNKNNSKNICQEHLDNYYMGSSTGFLDLIKNICNEQEDNPNYRKNDKNNFNNYNNNNNQLNNNYINQNEMNNLNKNINNNYIDKYNNDNQFIKKNENPNQNNNNYNDKCNNNLNNYNSFINNNENSNKNMINNNNINYNNSNSFINNNENSNKNMINNNNINYNNSNSFINNNENSNKNIFNNNNINYNNSNSFINNNENSNKNMINSNNNINYNNYNSFINKNIFNNNTNYIDYNSLINNNENSNKNIISNNNTKYDNYNSSINNNENINERDNIMADSIYGLSDGQILAKRENEIKELERQQLEKEKKEEEEKKKILEEENRIKKLNRKYIYEAKIAKLILSKEPEDDNPDVCHIKFRHPDGEKIIERKFLKTDRIASLYDYVKSIGREIFMEEDAFDFELIGGFPPKSLEDKKNNTLEEEGMFPNYILQIREK